MLAKEVRILAAFELYRCLLIPIQGARLREKADRTMTMNPTQSQMMNQLTRRSDSSVLWTMLTLTFHLRQLSQVYHLFTSGGTMS